MNGTEYLYCLFVKYAYPNARNWCDEYLNDNWCHSVEYDNIVGDKGSYPYIYRNLTKSASDKRKRDDRDAINMHTFGLHVDRKSRMCISV